ncbi:hypothetical protein [Actibacterium sp.]
MKTKRRWMAWVLEESAKGTPPMPWQRTVRPHRAAASRAGKAA